VLTKELAAQHQEALRVPGLKPSPDTLLAGVVSSATTRSGRPLRILHSAEESAPWPQDDGVPVKDRTLVLYSPRHGVRLGEGPGRVLLPVTPHPNTVDVLLDLLGPAIRPRIRYLVAPVSALKWITVALQERGVDPSALQVREIGTNGYTLTDHARLWLSRAWGAPVYDNYSLSEIPGYAAECDTCGFLHWSGLPVVTELLDPLTRAPVRGNLGELVITTLFPGVMLMPLIRYATGDLVLRGPLCSVTGTRGMKFAGRVTQSLIARGRPASVVTVAGRDLQEWAEAAVEVAQHPHPLEAMGRVPPSDIGVPKVTVDPSAWCVNVELRFDPARHPERAARVSADLAEHCFRGRAKRPEIRLMRSGSLDLARLALKL